MNIQNTTTRTAVPTEDGRAPVALRILFGALGLTIVLALHAPIAMLAAHIIA